MYFTGSAGPSLQTQCGLLIELHSLDIYVMLFPMNISSCLYSSIFSLPCSIVYFFVCCSEYPALLSESRCSCHSFCFFI
ncbi:hypothetical protein GLYMA_09G028500v4 [Glycine max]|uniref:Uncharacterized protein n=2 Tax=Glycine subgen. Soja TaxID=1462606 RepID=A0A0R0I2Y2_SOYBN|nr:hypothetical protein JHK85_024409 [Glycine max]KAH1041225.1 hypothetical protein GYH30_023854 [Glycine max]KRH36855.1 hypothetical protein GLYMA_09G028500v4 [Glycine max]RZB90352.1 hypothetical protein D0Y65_023013 [Glycine soja]